MVELAHLKFIETVSVIVLCVVLCELQVRNVALIRSVLVLFREFFKKILFLNKFFITLILNKLTVLIMKVFEDIHVLPVFGAIHFHFELAEVHDEEQSWLIGWQNKVFVLEKASILMEISVLSHSI